MNQLVWKIKYYKLPGVIIYYLINGTERGQRDSTAGKVFALHMVDISLIADTPLYFPKMPGVILESRVEDKPWVLAGVASKQTNRNFK